MTRGWIAALCLAAVLAEACSSAVSSPEASGPVVVEPSDATDPTGPTLGATGPSGVTAPIEPDEPERLRFAGRISPVPALVEADMLGKTWEPGCPVPMADLRLLRFNYLGFTDEIKRGRMVVHEDVATDVLSVFEQLFEARFPFKHVELSSRWRPNGPVDTTRSKTAAFNCRPALNPDLTPTGTWSEHAYGLAIDINPLQNPYVAPDGTVQRPAAEVYLDRTRDLPGMIHDGDLVVRAFAGIGWEWGGHWSGSKDYMHFSLRGR